MFAGLAIFGGVPLLRMGAGSRPGGRGTFLCFAKETYPKERRPTVCGPFGATCGGAVVGCAVELALRCARRSDNHGESVYASKRAPTRLLTPQPPRRRRSQMGETTEHPNNPTGHRCARPRLRSARRLRPRDGAERSDGPSGCWLPIPSGCAWGAQGAGWRVCRRTHPLRDLTRRGCLSVARQRVASSTAHPATAPPQVCPEGVADCGSPFLCLLSFGEAKESEAPAGARPGTRPPHKHSINY